MNSPPALSTADTPYRGRLIAVGTRHGKQHQFAPAFRALLSADLVTPADLDTDRFGAFTGEVARRGPAEQAARAKARLAMEVTGLPYGLASEASYGALPGGWFGHEEIVVFCDDALGIEVLEGHGSKGITDTAAVHSAITAAAAASPEGLAVVEPDLRAHCNPSRRKVLRRLAARLASRLATECPACAAPGFGRVDAEPGLPCRDCDSPTPLVGAQIHGCAVCPHQLTLPVTGDADPAVCPSCNP